MSQEAFEVHGCMKRSGRWTRIAQILPRRQSGRRAELLLLADEKGKAMVSCVPCSRVVTLMCNGNHKARVNI